MDQVIRPIIIGFPVWEEKTWDSLKEKKLDQARIHLESFLKSFSRYEWENVFWESLFVGIPAVRAGYTEAEWDAEVVPMLAKAILGSTNGQNLSFLYRTLPPEIGMKFHTHILDAIPKGSLRDKLEWLKIFKSSCYIFYLTSPAQELISIVPIPKPLPREQVLEQFKILPQSLKDALWSYTSAETIYRIGKSHNLSDERIHSLARVLGHVLFGFVYSDNLENELETALLVDKRVCDKVGEEIREALLSTHYEEVLLVYTPISDILERVRPTEPFTEVESVSMLVPPKQKVISLDTLDSDYQEAQQTERVAIDIKSPTKTPPARPRPDIREILGPKPQSPQGGDTPLLIYQEKDMAPAAAAAQPEGEKKTFFKNFSLPFDFFKSKRIENIASEITARIEAGGEPKKVVNYNENRSQSTPFGKTEEIVSLEKLQEKKPL